jgi:gluconokinase
LSKNEADERPDSPSQSIVVMGVSGSGKTTIGVLLADRIAAQFLDGDDLHPEGNVLRMAAGYPLSDDERIPWLHIVGKRLQKARTEGSGLVMACSALKHSYREILRKYDPDTFFLFLDGSSELVQKRVSSRNHEFMPASLIESQFKILEPLGPGENGMRVDIAMTPQAAIEHILQVKAPPTENVLMNEGIPNGGPYPQA